MDQPVEGGLKDRSKTASKDQTATNTQNKLKRYCPVVPPRTDRDIMTRWSWQKHQKYFPLFDVNNQLTNIFLLVANLPDKKGYIKKGNQRVIEARLSDAKFFWEKNKTQNLVKQITKLKTLSFFNQLGTFYDRTQRLRKLSSLASDQLNLS